MSLTSTSARRLPGVLGSVDDKPEGFGGGVASGLQLGRAPDAAADELRQRAVFDLGAGDEAKEALEPRPGVVLLDRRQPGRFGHTRELL